MVGVLDETGLSVINIKSPSSVKNDDEGSA